jgi:DNA-binding transcriptional regulator YdaS (Cro superfamily)
MTKGQNLYTEQRQTIQWPKVRRRTLNNDRQYNDQRSEDVHWTTTDNTMTKGQKTYTEQRQTIQWPKVRRREQRQTIQWPKVRRREQRQTIQWPKVRRRTLNNDRQCNDQRSEDVHWTTTDNTMTKGQNLYTKQRQTIQWPKVRRRTLNNDRQCNDQRSEDVNNDRQYNDQRSEDVHWTTTDNTMTKGQKTYTEQRQTIQWPKDRICTLHNDRKYNDQKKKTLHFFSEIVILLLSQNLLFCVNVL